MVHFSYNSYNLTISYNSYLAYEVVFLHHLRNSTGPKGTPLEYFRLCETFFFEKNFPKGPFQFFWHCETFFNFFSPKDTPFNFLLICDRMDEKSQCPLWCTNSVELLGFSGTVEYFDTLKPVCYF